MAVAARPGPSDGRVPCSQCGGLIHPIAGRCKHCKADLSMQRGARPAAAAALPALAKLGSATPPVGIPAPIPRVAHDPAFTAAAMISPGEPPMQVAGHVHHHIQDNDSRPVLPPRPTGRLDVPHQGWMARHWPVLVILLAAIAIVGAVVIMLLPPPANAASGTKAGAPGPANDRMQTNPLPPSSQLSPLPSPPPGTIPQQPDPLPAPDPAPDNNAQIDPNDPLSDPFANPFGNGTPSGGLGLGAGTSAAILGNVLHRMCEKAKTCANSQALAAMCGAMTRSLPRMAMPANCPAAQKCLEVVDQLDICDGSANSMDFPSMALSTTACVEAMTNC